MKRIFIFISSFFIFSVLSLNLSAQYGPQFDNRGFEQWTNRASEPSHWHSGGTADGSYSSFLPDDLIESSTHTRPGSTGTKSVRLVPREVGFLIWTYTANGNLTNGRIHAGDTSPSGSGNYSYTQRSESAFNTTISQLPDSLSIWVCFRCTSTTEKAQVKAVVHGNADYQIIADGTEAPANMRVATAVQSFTRTSTANGAYTWRRLSIPFNNNGSCTDVRYILFTATTNETPASGSTSDDLFVDDVLLIYNPSLSMGQLASTSYAPNAAITIPFTLTGTMSPENLNASANQVIAQLSDGNGNFNNPTELGRVTTNSSGSITATIPNVAAGNGYRIRVISTNYPMVGGNIQTVSIAANTATITVAANPSEGGTVSGGGTYNQGESCTVSATANTGYTFTNWTENGTVVSTNASYTFNVSGDRSLVANFTLNNYTITATAEPSNGGNIAGSGNFNYGETCTLTATSNTGYTFVNWTKNGTQVSTNATYSFTVTESATYVAHFSANSYTINVTTTPSNGGTASGGGTYTYGQSCTVSATPATGYRFVNWMENGNHVTSQPSYTFNVTGDRDLLAHFSLQSYTITASADPTAGGNVTGDGSYHHGETCTLTATTNTGYTFVNWTKDGTQVSTNATYSFTVNESATYIAHFTLNSYDISATADPSEGGSVDGAGTYEHGATCTLTATVNENYEFVNWTKDDIEVSTDLSYTFTVTEPAAFVAHFRYFDNVGEEMGISQIFPNPFTSKVSIKAEKTIMSVSVYDINGRLVKKQDVSDTHVELDLTGCNAGAYLLQVDYGDSRSVHQIMKAE
ncbi:MAG: InlB B-repeat-containing protein [Bacteroidales bacterium]|nr:InlB B-repeat-containing protein [Bacteroidales bacterium]